VKQKVNILILLLSLLTSVAWTQSGVSTQFVCAGSPLMRYSITGDPGTVYTWQVLGGSGTIDSSSVNHDTIWIKWNGIVANDTLEVYGVNAYGCQTARKRLAVSYKLNPVIELDQNVSICEGSSHTYSVDPYPYILWEDSTMSQNHTVFNQDTILVQVTDSFGCIGSDTSFLTVNMAPVVELPNDTTICGPMGITLDAGSFGTTYEWSTGDITSSITVHEGEKYVWVRVTDAFGCESADTMSILPCDMNNILRHLPLVITPGKIDGRNDVWDLNVLEKYPHSYVEIYDRANRLVYRSERGYPAEKAWDGKASDGSKLPMDSYLFIIYFNEKGVNPFVGTVTILR
jgi:gliding motility-associated-like protein